ncbi:MAG TPA: hypothetical protein VH206_14440 [Xanthobacteraceae bacterium]|jgi:hypothetical protein|nr:hypothetical protein [Xanthobacteraceae bacterium]
MTNIDATVQIVLENVGYTTWLLPLDRLTGLCFEDDTIMGFVCVFTEPGDLLSHWKSIEASLLFRYASRFRAAEDKAWNVYTIFLCAKDGTEEQKREIARIDENLERTRKIAACGLAGHEDVVNALLPVLPIQYRPSLESEDFTERLKKRIAAIAPQAVDVALNEDVGVSEVVPLLGTES